MTGWGKARMVKGLRPGLEPGTYANSDNFHHTMTQCDYHFIIRIVEQLDVAFLKG